MPVGKAENSAARTGVRFHSIVLALGALTQRETRDGARFAWAEHLPG